MINVPIIPGTLAVRAVIYDDSRGGYIHNVPATFTRSPTDAGIAYYFGGVVPPGSTSLSNANLVSSAFNPITYEGVRVSALYQFNQDWNLLLQQSYQSMEADGVFAYDPALGDLDVQQYNPSTDLDKFEDTAWTLNGRIGAAQARLHGRLPGTERRSDGRLHELRARPFRRLLSVQRTAIHARGDCHMLFAELDLAQRRAKHPPEPRISGEHARRCARAG